MDKAIEAAGAPSQLSDGPDPVGRWFGLSRDAYFVMPRLAIEAMTMSWQRRFVALMEEADATGMETPGYYVLRDDRLYTHVRKYDEDDPSSRDYEYTALQEDEWANYRRGSAEALCPKFSLPANGAAVLAAEDPVTAARWEHACRMSWQTSAEKDATIAELKAELQRYRGERSYVVGFNEGYDIGIGDAGSAQLMKDVVAVYLYPDTKTIVLPGDPSGRRPDPVADILALAGEPIVVGSIAKLLRDAGEIDIPESSHGATATVLHWLIGIALKHGHTWSEAYNREAARLRDLIDAKRRANAANQNPAR